MAILVLFTQFLLKANFVLNFLSLTKYDAFRMHIFHLCMLKA